MSKPRWKAQALGGITYLPFTIGKLLMVRGYNNLAVGTGVNLHEPGLERWLMMTRVLDVLPCMGELSA